MDTLLADLLRQILSVLSMKTVHAKGQKDVVYIRTLRKRWIQSYLSNRIRKDF